MDSAITETVSAWLSKAGHDLSAARLLGDNQAGLLDVAVYHCQQAAEKALKAFLAANNHPVERTHDLKLLVSLCSSFDSSMAQWTADAAFLAPMATSFRYPDDLSALEPTQTQFETALDSTERLFAFVLSLLPPETHPI